MPDHVAVPDRTRRSLRTIVNVALSVAVVVLGLVPVVLQAVEPLQEQLPEGWYLWLVGVAGTIVAVATAVQRILTSSVVEQLLQKKAPALAASPVGADGAAVVTKLSSDERTALAHLSTFLGDGDPAGAALDRVIGAQRPFTE
jgi:hypothetical protein